METPGRERSEQRRVPRTITPLSTPAYDGDPLLRIPLKKSELEKLVRAALEEDQAFNDITTIATVVSDRRARATLVARGTGTVCGVPLALEAFRQLDPKGTIRVEREDGWRVVKGDPVLFVNGHARGLLAAERVALNFMQRLSGIATLTARFVEAVAGTDAGILDTRKTTPGLRGLEKAAVAAGGGRNHRIGLYDAILIKENHIALAGSVAKAIYAARKARPELAVEIECRNLDEVAYAIGTGADILLLDNMDNETLRAAVALRDQNAGSGAGPSLEASGGVNLDTVRGIAETGVDLISVGALTHSAPTLDFSLLLEPLRA
jgi:nicotinate-nucleotide pyrophosphorylase (carboxylating)